MSQNVLEKLSVSKAEIARLKDLPFPEGDDVMKKAIVNLASYEPETFANLMGSHAADFTSLIQQTLKDPSLQTSDVQPQSESGAEGLGLSQSPQHAPKPTPTRTVCTFVGQVPLCRQVSGSSGSGSGSGISSRDSAITIVAFSSLAILVGIGVGIGGILTAVEANDLRVEYFKNISEQKEKMKQTSKIPEIQALKKKFNEIKQQKFDDPKAKMTALRSVDDDFRQTLGGQEFVEARSQIKSLKKQSLVPKRIAAASLLSVLGAGIIGAGIYGAVSSSQGLLLADDEDYLTTVQALWRAVQDLGPSKDCLH
ncbi:MAG: hypothetical protein KA436_12820 [Oligoflexales bacterium]|nr:hypothetical protein [Oligoflexales bacterium]